MNCGERGAPSERAQSEVLGTVLLLGLTVAVVGTTVALGGAALDDSQRTADFQRVEGAMTQVDSKASLVAHGESPAQRVRMDVRRNADLRVDEDAGWMRIEVTTSESPNATNETVPLGAVVYERGGDTVAYQGGGVWRSTGGGSTMVSPPEFHYRGTGGTETLTLPLVTIENSSERLGDEVRITGSGARPEQVFPSPNGSNPLLGGNVTITVQSDYADAWGRFFETRTSASVTDLTDRRVEVRLRTKTIHPTLSAGVSATGRSTFDTGGVDRLEADSYDSTDETYANQTPSDGAVIQTRDQFRLTAGGGGNTETITIRGDLIAESYNIPSGQSDKLNVTGDRRTEAAFDSLPAVDGAITARIDDVRDRDLAANGDYRGSGFDLSGDDVEEIRNDTFVDGDVSLVDQATLIVTDGATLHVNGTLTAEGTASRVELDSGGGDVEVLTEGAVNLTENATIRSLGGGNADLSVDDSLSLAGTASVTTGADTRLEVHNTGDIDIDDAASMTADEDKSGNLWTYSSADTIEFEGGVGNGVRFTGMFYAPQSAASLADEMEIYGSFTFETFSFDDAEIDIHYDESLQTEQPFEGNSVPVVSHLHVSRHGVVVESD
ncbi:hypothetical protein C464_11383 [Halorubrum coriense DSM 10284]|uniref:DUF7305 domain-containing protein n=1 Tax=Halorubrum coriense DSM 10284 TaxID=1227466 RepID=M0EEM5_9EURY|nr:hypothetical protein [Halorubrum coriense]ELZ46200.1 hypothetical protein C464_11383 [Halorubrum coriense DSM 10284]